MLKKIQSFFSLPTSSGIVLIISAILGIITANSQLAEIYFFILNIDIGSLSILYWINDGLMAIFFLYVGLELKREFLVGELATNSQRILPSLAAIAG
ncbi:TPA: Na(+)/H(+) antiporter NhaA, partial [Escherichia coli]|nr:Na(+)/H(+) antiporter NhaA [Escherichia coli]